MEDPLSTGTSALGAFQQLGAALRIAADIFDIFVARFPSLTQLTHDLERVHGLVFTDVAAYLTTIQSIRVEQLDGEQPTRMPEGPANVQAHKYAKRAGDVTVLCSILRGKSRRILRGLEQISGRHSGWSKFLLRTVESDELEQQLQGIIRMLEQLQTLVRIALPPSVDRDIPKGLMQRETPKASGKAQEHTDFMRQILPESDISEPNRTDKSSGTYSLGAESIFDRYSSTVGSRASDLSFSEEHFMKSIQKRYPRPSFAGHDESDVQYVDSRGLAVEIIRRLRSELGPVPIHRNGLAINDKCLSSKLREILESYCAEIESTIYIDARFPLLSQDPLHLKGNSMVLKEIEFLVEELVSIFEGDVNLFPVEPPHGSKARAGDKGKDTVPIFVVRDFLMTGEAFGRLKLRIRRHVKQDIMQIISDEVSLNLPSIGPGLTMAAFHVRWELFHDILNELILPK